MPVEPRPWEEVRAIMAERAEEHRNPFTVADPATVADVLDRLGSVDRDPWAVAFGACAQPYIERGEAAERAGDRKAARDAYLAAYDYWRVARYPAPNSPEKRRAYKISQDLYLRAARLGDHPMERVEIPFKGRAGEGSSLVVDVHKPSEAPSRMPVVMQWGGIDSFKEERRAEPYLAAGFTCICMDMPGVGDAPLAGSEDAERQWDFLLDWIEQQPELDSRRVAVVGASTGGYWGAKLAHTHRERLRAAVDHAGPAHLAFQPDWIARAQRGEYPFELAETLACAFGRSTYDEWVAFAPRLSLLDQGWLDKPCAPLLLINGVDDSVFPIQDMYLLLEHGNAKMARFFLGEGHMGGPQAIPTIVAWLREQLA